MATYLADNYFGAQQRVSVVSGVGGMVGGARGRGAIPSMQPGYGYAAQSWEPYPQQPEPYPTTDPTFFDDVYSANQPTYPGFPARGAQRGLRDKRGGFNMRGTGAMVSRGGRSITNTSSTSNLEKPANEDACKMFVGGLDWELTADQIHEYFEMFGPVVEVKLKTDIYTGQSRGFAFLLFQNAESVDKVLQNKNHMIYGKRIDPKRAVASEGSINTKKVFVGGIDPVLTEKEIADAFSVYGKVLLVELPVDRSNNQRRSFGFVLFESEDTVNELCEKSRIQLGSKMVDIRKMQHKDEINQSKNFMGAKKRGGLYGYNQAPVNPYADQGMYGQMYDYYDPSQQPPLMPDAMYGYEQAAAPYRGFRPGPSMPTRNIRGYHPYSR